MQIVKTILRSLLFIFLTALTQIGGIVYLLTFPFDKFIHQQFPRPFARVAIQFGLFVILYSTASIAIVPLLARPNFPFFDGFPLIPHLSHSDGRKLDIAFCYIDAQAKKPSNDAPSIIGYGISEVPAANEPGMPSHCGKNNWQYNLMTKLVPQGRKAGFLFDDQRTKDMIKLFSQNQAIEKIFIEPHLKTRLKLTSDKVRFHGCHAVRHDDHIHVQLPG